MTEKQLPNPGRLLTVEKPGLDLAPLSRLPHPSPRMSAEIPDPGRVVVGTRIGPGQSRAVWSLHIADQDSPGLAGLVARGLQLQHGHPKDPAPEPATGEIPGEAVQFPLKPHETA